jgi:rRNA maturation protein Nop10
MSLYPKRCRKCESFTKHISGSKLTPRDNVVYRMKWEECSACGTRRDISTKPALKIKKNEN